MLKQRVETIYPEIVAPRYLWLDTVVEEWDFRDQDEQTPDPHANAPGGQAGARGLTQSRIPDYGDRRVIRLQTDDPTPFFGPLPMIVKEPVFGSSLVVHSL
jgi:hypothetical protein